MFDAVVIGAGASGMTAALYLKRYNLNVLLIEKSAPGGVMNITSKIDNYPGYKGINGVDLAMSMYEQITELNVELKMATVLKVDSVDDYKVVKTDKEEIKTKTVIIATGRVPRKLGLEHEDELAGRGISWCAICDGFFYKDKNVAIVGAGNSALEESLFLATLAKNVYIINRSDEFKGDAIFLDKIKKHDNIKIFNKSQVTELLKTDNKLSGIMINGEKELDIEGMFLYIGYEPDLKCLKKDELETIDGYIKVDRNMRTNIKGIYACGDIVKKDVYQITTATGDATIAATSVKNDITN